MATNPYMATGGGAGVFMPNGSYSGGGMSGDASRQAPSLGSGHPNGITPTQLGGPTYSAAGIGPQSSGSEPQQQNLGFVTQPQNLGMGQMKTDWNSYFDGAKPGASTNWGGGTLTMGADGQAKYSAQGALNGGTTINRNSIDNPASLQMLMAQAPGIAQQWKQQYGMDSGMNANDQAYWSNTLAQQGNQPGAAANTPIAQPTQATAQPSTPNLGMGGANPYAPQQAAQSPQQPDTTGRNPYLQQVGQALTAQSNQNLRQNVLPGIGQGAQASGMYGSSRQGVAEGVAMGNAQTGLNSALANMYSQGYGQDQQNALGNKQADNSYSLGMGNLALGNKGTDNSFRLGMGNLGLGMQQANNSYDLGLRSNDLGFAGLDANINQQNFSNQMAGAQFGLGIYDRMNGYNQQGTANGTQIQNTPINYFNGFNNNTTALAGQGGNNVVAQQGSVLGAGLGAGLGTYGMFQGQPTSQPAAVRNWLNAGRD